jgi:hypothetical protein
MFTAETSVFDLVNLKYNLKYNKEGRIEKVE